MDGVRDDEWTRERKSPRRRRTWYVKKKTDCMCTHEVAAMTKRVWFAVRTSQFTPENQSGKLFTHFSD